MFSGLVSEGKLSRLDETLGSSFWLWQCPVMEHRLLLPFPTAASQKGVLEGKKRVCFEGVSARGCPMGLWSWHGGDRSGVAPGASVQAVGVGHKRGCCCIFLFITVENKVLMKILASTVLQHFCILAECQSREAGAGRAAITCCRPRGSAISTGQQAQVGASPRCHFTQPLITKKPFGLVIYSPSASPPALPRETWGGLGGKLGAPHYFLEQDHHE